MNNAPTTHEIHELLAGLMTGGRASSAREDAEAVNGLGPPGLAPRR
jgi:hypothetical protein